MTHTLSRAPERPPHATAQQLLLSAIALHEKAIKHHRHAAQLYERGDRRQANTHASIACTHGRAALAAGSVYLAEDAQRQDADAQPQELASALALAA